MSMNNIIGKIKRLKAIKFMNIFMVIIPQRNPLGFENIAIM